MCVAGIITMIICFGAAYEFDLIIHLPKYIHELVKIITVAVLCLVVYIPLNLIFKMEYAEELLNRIKSKLCK